MAHKLEVDNLVVGAGFFGLYCAYLATRRGESVLVVEMDDQPLQRASYVNQARLHFGYHYPRSLQTARKTANYFHEFLREFGDCVNTSFQKIYAVARDFSYTNPEQFASFCKYAEIPCREVPLNGLFNSTNVQAAFETSEHSFDAPKLRKRMLERLKSVDNLADFRFGCRPLRAKRCENAYKVFLSSGEVVVAKHVLNATYASINQVNHLFRVTPLKIKYELCEVALCDVSDPLKDTGITLMDGPFFSLMPFGFSGFHSLTSVTFTPHKTTGEELPTFDCQSRNSKCSPSLLDNCNTCPSRPNTAWEAMSRLAMRYLDSSIRLRYQTSLFGVKAVLQRAEVDDSRPTILERTNSGAAFTTVLSGKINTVFDLMEG
jgi:hypothetical protein